MTTWNERFAAALALLCGGKQPPAQSIVDHFDMSMDSFELQAWAVNNAALPWAQGVAIIDAARTLADQPEEGASHTDEGAPPEPYCVACGDGIVPHNPGICGTCYAIKHAGEAVSKDAVYHALSPRARLRTSPENVCDVLAAVAHVTGQAPCPHGFARVCEECQPLECAERPGAAGEEASHA